MKNARSTFTRKWTESKVLKWRDLTGPEKHKLLKEIDIVDVFPRIPQARHSNMD